MQEKCQENQEKAKKKELESTGGSMSVAKFVEESYMRLFYDSDFKFLLTSIVNDSWKFDSCFILFFTNFVTLLDPSLESPLLSLWCSKNDVTYYQLHAFFYHKNWREAKIVLKNKNYSYNTLSGKKKSGVSD